MTIWSPLRDIGATLPDSKAKTCEQHLAPISGWIGGRGAYLAREVAISATFGGVAFTGTPTLRLTRSQQERILASCYDGLPNEACGLLGGPALGALEEPTGVVTQVFPTSNVDASSLTYTVDGKEMLRAMRSMDEVGEVLVGCWHSHTHTEAYPSPTDVRTAAANPNWIYVIVSLKPEHGQPVLRAYRMRDGVIAEVAVDVVG